MILMSKYKGQHGGKRGRKIRARPSPLPFRTMPERKRFCYKRCSLTNICAGIPFLPLSLTNLSPGTPWQGLGFSLSQSTFSSLSRLRRRARGSWCGFGTASGQSSSPSASKLNPNDDQGRSVWKEGVRSFPAKQLLGPEQHQGENRVAGGEDSNLIDYIHFSNSQGVL